MRAMVMFEDTREPLGFMELSDEALHVGELSLVVLRHIGPTIPRKVTASTPVDVITLRVTDPRVYARHVSDPRMPVVLIPTGLTPVTAPYEFLSIVRACHVIHDPVRRYVGWIEEMIREGRYD